MLLFSRSTNEPPSTLRRIEYPGYLISKVTVAPDGSEVMATRYPGGLNASKAHEVSVGIAELSSGKLTRDFISEPHPRCTRYSPDGKRVAIAIEKEVRIFNRDSLKELSRITFDVESMLNATFSRDGKRLVAIANPNGVYLLEDIDRPGGRFVERVGPEFISSDSPFDILVPDDPDQLLLMNETRCDLWSLSQRKLVEPSSRLPWNSEAAEIAQMLKRTTPFNGLLSPQVEWSPMRAALSESSTLLALSRPAGSVQVWDLNRRSPVAELLDLETIEHNSPFVCFADHDRSLIVAYSARRRRLFFDLRPPFFRYHWVIDATEFQLFDTQSWQRRRSWRIPEQIHEIISLPRQSAFLGRTNNAIHMWSLKP